MRLSVILLQQHRGKMFYKKWLQKSKMKVIDMQVPEKLTQMGITIKKMEDVASPRTLLNITIPDPYKKPLMKDENHLDYRTRVCHCYNQDIRLLEGDNQASVLTKTLIRRGFPDSYGNLIDKAKEKVNSDGDRVDEMMKRYIMQAKIWDAWQLKLPKEKSDRPGWERRHYGIPVDRQNWTMWEQFLHLSNCMTAEYVDTFDRTFIYSPNSLNYLEKDGDLMSMNVKANFMLSNLEPLKPIGNDEEIRETVDESLPDLFPIKCTIDLRQENFYDLRNDTTLKASGIHPHLHTLIFLSLSGSPRSQAQVDGNVICNCFSFCLSRAKQIYGEDVQGILPKPVTVQAIQATNRTVSFLIYQLNTTDINGMDGVKNLAWLDSENELYQSCDINGIEGFNPEVFPKLLAFHINGLNK